MEEDPLQIDIEEQISESPPEKPASKKRLNIIRGVVMLLVIALTVVLVIYRDQIQALQAYGYPGIFLFSILANATILIPIPGVVFTSAMGAVFNPFWVSVAAGAGAALGELSGYLAGFSGQAVVENSSTVISLSSSWRSSPTPSSTWPAWWPASLKCRSGNS
jgi:hypothetical protein